ncbi:MAG: DUF4178 domain-containing protein [Deltaproteobacteria bacterium]|nr:DUF4178 domain-containing protein [Deltaproteobacteria bacterium]
MSRAVQCPSCGAQHEVQNPGITALGCRYCHTLIYWDEQAVHDSGRKALLDPPSSALRVGEPCTLNRQHHQVLGRVRYTYGAGVWDEWFLESPRGEIVWLTEDEKEFAVEKPVSADPRLPPFEQLRVGATVTVHQRPFLVEELGRATCQGVEGQVPWLVLPDEVYPFADLASPDGKISLGVEYDQQGAPSLFLGEFVERGALLVQGGPPFPEQVATGVGVRCAGCGAPIEHRFPPETSMLVCPQCGAGLQLSATQTKVITRNSEQVSFTLAIGDVCTFDKLKYEVVGRLRYVEEGVYVSDEYLLWADQQGYLWLEESNRHWVLNRRSHQAPGVDIFSMLKPKDRIKIGATSFQFVESGTEELRYVDGALPWLAQVGERFQYADLVAPPRSYCAERSVNGDSQEIEFFAGRYVPVEEMERACGKKLSRSLGVAAAQPFIRTRVQTALMWIGILFTLLNGALCGMASTRGGRVVLREQFSAEQYRAEALSQPFQIRFRPSVVAIRSRAPVDNAWVSTQLGIVNANDEVLFDTEDDVSYYHGVEGGESWSEGSQSSTRYIRIDQPGWYRLLVYGQAGTGEAPAASGGPTLAIEVSEGVMPGRYFWWMIVLSALYPLKEILRKYSHEKRRIPSDDDDDDD